MAIVKTEEIKLNKITELTLNEADVRSLYSLLKEIQSNGDSNFDNNVNNIYKLLKSNYIG